MGSDLQDTADRRPGDHPGQDRLRFRDLRRSYGRLRVLRGVSGQVDPGDLLLVTGSNGSGKSTLLRCLSGLLVAQRGTIEYRLGGHQLSTEERRRAVGWVAPDLEFYPQLTTLENLDFFARLRGIEPQHGRQLLDHLGLPRGREAAALSSGMRQRLRWCWALAHRPRLLLLDEPLQNLDAQGRRDVRRLLEQHLDDGSLAVVANPDDLELPRVTTRLDLDS